MFERRWGRWTKPSATASCRGDELVSFLAFWDQVTARVAGQVGEFDQRVEWAFDGQPRRWPG